MSNDLSPLDPSGDSGITVRVGEKEFSLREYQDLFTEVTGGDNRLTRRFQRPFIFRVDDLKSLYQRLSHTISNFRPSAATCKVVVSHLEENVQEFKSFEAFLGYETSVSSAVSSVSVELHFAVQSPIDTKKTRAYSIRLFLNSQISDLKEQEDEPYEFGFLGYTCTVHINYFDYAIGVSCMAIVENWTKSLATIEENKAFKVFYKYREILLVAFHTLFLTSTSILFFVICGAMNARYFGLSVTSNNLMSQAVFLAFVVTICLGLNQGTYMLTRSLRLSIGFLNAHSIILLNKSDEKLFEWYHKKRSRSVFLQSSAFVGSLLYSLAVNSLVKLLLTKQGV